MASIEKHGSITVFRPEGPIRSEALDGFSDKVNQNLGGGIPMFVLDMNGVPLIDGSGLEWILDLNDRCCRRGGNLRLCNVGELCGDLLRITGIRDSVESFQDLTEAISSFA